MGLGVPPPYWIEAQLSLGERLVIDERMMPVPNAFQMPCLVLPFTLIGKSGRAPLGAPIAAMIVLLSAETAAAKAEIGPSSSARIEIMVSVAPAYGLKERIAVSQASDLAAGYCLASNAKPIALPVHLVRNSSGEQDIRTGQAKSMELGPCKQAGGNIELPRGEGLLIVRPE